MSAYPPGELQWAAAEMPGAMARLEIQNVYAFQGAKPSPTVYRDVVLLEELGSCAFRELQDANVPPECEHDRLLTDDCDECERY